MLVLNLLLLALTSLSYGQHVRDVIQQYVADPGVELENIAVRSNGNVLLTAGGLPSIISLVLNPRRSFASELSPFPNVTSLFGIGEIAPDLFAVAGGVSGRGIPPAAGSFTVFAINVTTVPAAISTIANIPTAGLLNGLTVIPNRPGQNATVLVSDTLAGTIYALNPTTGQYATAFTSSPTATNSSLLRPGINGIRYLPRTRTLYFANTLDQTFGSVKLACQSSRAGPPVVNAASKPRVIASGVPVDDFTVLPDGTAFAAANPANTVLRISNRGAVSTVLTGANYTLLKAPTSGAFGRGEGDRGSLYVTSLGLAFGANGTSPGGGLFELRF